MRIQLLLAWFAVCILWGTAVAQLLPVTQGVYEDHIHRAGVLGIVDRPSIFTSRGIATRIIWEEAHANTSPMIGRLVNIGLSLIASALLGLLAWRLGVPTWVAVGVLLLHPLMIETMAMLSGHAELIAAIGVLIACVSATLASGWLSVTGVLLGITLGLMGKESAIVGVALAPLIALIQRRRWAGWLTAAGIIVVGLSATLMRFAAKPTDIPSETYRWFLIQAGATVRLLTLTLVNGHARQTVDFDYDALTPWWLGLAVVTLAICAWSLPVLWNWSRVVGASLAWMLIVSLPRWIVQTPRSYFNEHQFYLGLVGFALGCAAVSQKGLDALSRSTPIRR